MYINYIFNLLEHYVLNFFIESNSYNISQTGEYYLKIDFAMYGLSCYQNGLALNFSKQIRQG